MPNSATICTIPSSEVEGVSVRLLYKHDKGIESRALKNDKIKEKVGREGSSRAPNQWLQQRQDNHYSLYAMQALMLPESIWCLLDQGGGYSGVEVETQAFHDNDYTRICYGFQL